MTISETFASPQHRLDHVRELRDAGQTFAAIGKSLGLSASRAKQLYARAERLAGDLPPLPVADIDLATPTGRLPLRRLARRALALGGFPTLGDLVAIERADLLPRFLALPDANRRGWNEIVALLDDFAGRS